MGRKIGKILIVLSFIFLLSGMRLKAEEAPEMYQILCDEPNGRNDYYTAISDIVIEHFDETFITKYKLIFPKKKELSGVLNKVENKVTIPAELLEEGTHQLVVWMEDEQENKLEKTEKIIEIKMDREAPDGNVRFTYPVEEKEQTICINKQISINLEAEDKISGVEAIYYSLDGGRYDYLEGNKGVIEIPQEFSGSILAYAVDRAGNKGAVTESKEIICEGNAPEIILNAPNGFAHWYNKTFLTEINVQEKEVSSGIKTIQCSFNGREVLAREYDRKSKREEKLHVAVESAGELVVAAEDWAGNKILQREQILYDDKLPQVEIIGMKNYMICGEAKDFVCQIKDEHRIEEVRGSIILKRPDGREEKREIENWEQDGAYYRTSERLSESGMYKLQIEAKDQAGNQSVEEMQLILDQENPVIQKVEEFQGKYLKYFEWDLPISDVIEDFTTYTYHVTLDNRICEMNKRYTKEGIHSLEISAKDAAGNEANTKAEFVIDHTAPEIQIFEKEDAVQILTEGKQDFLEKIVINGEEQKIRDNKHVFEYTYPEDGKYKIKILAVDKAGNEAEKEVEIEFKEKKGFLQKVTGSSKKGISSEIDENVKEEELTLLGKRIEILVIVCGSIGGIAWFILRKRNLNREDAG